MATSESGGVPFNHTAIRITLDDGRKFIVENNGNGCLEIFDQNQIDMRKFKVISEHKPLPTVTIGKVLDKCAPACKNYNPIANNCWDTAACILSTSCGDKIANRYRQRWRKWIAEDTDSN